MHNQGSLPQPRQTSKTGCLRQPLTPGVQPKEDYYAALPRRVDNLVYLERNP